MTSERYVLVTGASSGIGKATALELKRRGWHVIAGIRNPADRAHLDDAARGIATVQLDITDPGSIHGATREVERLSTGAGLSALVSNAGIAIWGPLECVPISALREQLEVNVIGQMAVTQAMLPLLRRTGGRIVNIGSISGVVPLPFLGPYSASKAALEALTDSLRMELRGSGISVAIIEAGAIATPIWQRATTNFEQMKQQFPTGWEEHYGRVVAALERRAKQRGGEPADLVARVVADALAAPRMRCRYCVGRGVRMQLILRWLPHRLRDWLIARRLSRS